MFIDYTVSMGCHLHTTTQYYYIVHLTGADAAEYPGAHMNARVRHAFPSFSSH